MFKTTKWMFAYRGTTLAEQPPYLRLLQNIYGVMESRQINCTGLIETNLINVSRSKIGKLRFKYFLSHQGGSHLYDVIILKVIEVLQCS